MKIRLNGEDPPSLTTQQRKEWNAYVDWIDKKGYKGSPLLDKKDTGLASTLFNQFKKENPTVSLSLDHVKSVQSEMGKLASSAQEFEARRNNPDALKVMAGTSKVDGWPGSKTTSFKFPGLEENQYTNSALTSHRNLGILNPKLKPTDTASVASQSPLSTSGIKLEKMGDGKYYYQNRDGDWLPYNK